MGLSAPKYGYSNIDVNEYLGERADELRGYLTDARKDGSLVGFIGGPPCPDFSVAGKQRGRNGDNGKLSLSYINLIIAQQPDFFLFENVKGLWKTAKHREFYEELKEKDIDTLIMGCTHYPLIRSTIRKVMGDKVNLVNPAYETAIELKNLLERDNLANKCDVDSPSSMYRFYVSDAEEKFKLFANSILPFDITMTKQINIENY